MSQLLLLFWTGFVITAATALVPGPDVLLVLRCGLVRGRAAGLRAVLGIACGLVVYSLTALAAASIISLAPPLVFGVLRVAGALYLAYLGWSLLRADAAVGDILHTQGLGRSCLVQGFLTNVTNPKVLLFYVAVLTQFDAVRFGLEQRLALLAGAIVGPLSSMVLVVCVSGFIRPRLTPRLIGWIDRVSGMLMLGFALLALVVSGAG